MIVGLIHNSCKFNRYRIVTLLGIEALRNHCEITKRMNIDLLPVVIIILILWVKMLDRTVCPKHIFVHYLSFFLCCEVLLFSFLQIVVQPPEPISVNAIIISHFIYIFWKCVESVVNFFNPQ